MYILVIESARNIMKIIWYECLHKKVLRVRITSQYRSLVNKALNSNNYNLKEYTRNFTIKLKTTTISNIKEQILGLLKK